MEDATLFGRFNVVETITEGGALSAYRARTADGAQVYVRAVQASPEQAQSALASFPARMSGTVPRAVRLTDAGATDTGFFVAREWVEGETLDAYCARAEVDATAGATAVSAALADLSGLHRAGFVHGDVRSSNIIVGAAGEASLVDAALPFVPASTGGYTSPEELKGEQPGIAADIYRMGIVLYKAITGRLPFEAATAEELSAAHLSKIPALPTSLNPQSPSGLDAVALKALAKDPAERYGSAALMKEAIDAAVSAAESRVKPWMWIVGILAILALLGALWAAQNDQLPAWLLFGQGAQVATPSVVGMAQEAAETEIVTAGLTVGQVSEEPTLAVEPGTVTMQTPAAGVEAPEGSAVDLSVAAIPVVDVPDVVGDSQEEATVKLAEVGLRLDDIEYVYDADVDAGFVAAQEPEGGTEVAVASTVVLTVSKGEESGKVPNVVGLSQDDAVDALSAAGFESKTTKEQNSDVPAGDVIEQSPAAGTSATTGSSVTLTVSTGAPEEPTPPTEPTPPAEPDEPAAPDKPETPEKPAEPAAKATVPDVVGLGILEAIREVRGAELKIGIEWVADDANILKISAQDPEGGTEVDPGTTVTLSIGLPEFLIAGEAPPSAEQLPAPEPEQPDESPIETSTP